MTQRKLAGPVLAGMCSVSTGAKALSKVSTTLSGVDVPGWELSYPSAVAAGGSRVWVASTNVTGGALAASGGYLWAAGTNCYDNASWLAEFSATSGTPVW